MQTSKEQQDDIALAFTNPFYALLLVVWPWHPRAKRFQRNQATVWKVPYCCKAKFHIAHEMPLNSLHHDTRTPCMVV